MAAKKRCRTAASTEVEAANDNSGSVNSIDLNDMECHDTDLEPVDEEERRDGCVKDTHTFRRKLRSILTG